MASTSSSSSNSSSSSSGGEISRIFDRIRILVNDESSNRWTNQNILLWVNDAILDIRDMRPDVQININGNRRSYTRIRTIYDTIDLEDIWIEAIVNYACYRLMSESAEDTISQNKAEMFKQLFEENLKN